MGMPKTHEYARGYLRQSEGAGQRKSIDRSAAERLFSDCAEFAEVATSTWSDYRRVDAAGRLTFDSGHSAVIAPGKAALAIDRE